MICKCTECDAVMWHHKFYKDQLWFTNFDLCFVSGVNSGNTPRICLQRLSSSSSIMKASPRLCAQFTVSSTCRRHISSMRSLWWMTSVIKVGPTFYLFIFSCFTSLGEQDKAHINSSWSMQVGLKPASNHIRVVYTVYKHPACLGLCVFWFKIHTYMLSQ